MEDPDLTNPKNTSLNKSAYENIHCDYCKRLFQPTNKWQKFCKPKCRNNWHNDQRVLKDTKYKMDIPKKVVTTPLLQGETKLNQPESNKSKLHGTKKGDPFIK